MLTWDSSKCLRCGMCVGICPFGALKLENGAIVVDHKKCTLCGLCVKACPVAALEIKPQLEEIAKERGVSLA